MSQENIL